MTYIKNQKLLEIISCLSADSLDIKTHFFCSGFQTQLPSDFMIPFKCAVFTSGLLSLLEFPFRFQKLLRLQKLNERRSILTCTSGLCCFNGKGIRWRDFLLFYQKLSSHFRNYLCISSLTNWGDVNVHFLSIKEIRSVVTINLCCVVCHRCASSKHTHPHRTGFHMERQYTRLCVRTLK